MIDFESQFGKPTYSSASRQVQVASVFKYVYGWMSAGLALSGVVAWYTVASGLYATVLSRGGFVVCVLAELGLVLALTGLINKLSGFAATALFLLYAAVNGLTLSIVFIAYELALVQKIFFITAGMFGGLALWGSVTKGNLSSIGHICGMALWGLIVAIFVNMFWPSSMLDVIISFAGIVIFSGLTMYDAQKIRELARAEGSLDGAALTKVGIIGALALYLDFINLFLYLLRFFGRKR